MQCIKCLSGLIEQNLHFIWISISFLLVFSTKQQNCNRLKVGFFMFSGVSFRTSVDLWNEAFKLHNCEWDDPHFRTSKLTVVEGVEWSWIPEYCHTLGLFKASANIAISKASAWLNIENPKKGLLIFCSNIVYVLFSNTIIYFMLIRTFFPSRHFNFNCINTHSYFLALCCSCCN